MDLSRADVGAAREAIARNREMIAGVKARLSQDVAGANDFEVLRRAQEVASSFKIPVMIHMGQTVSPLPKLLALLKPGDIVTHMFAPPPNSIIDDNGHILPEVMAARRRGVIFDLGNGRKGHLRWDMAERVLQAGFLPDTFSTDWTPEARTAQVIDFPNVMSKFLMLGMSLDQVIACATVNASRAFPVFPQPGHAESGCAGRRRGAGTERRVFRICRQFREQAHRPPAAFPQCYRARRQTRFRSLTCPLSESGPFRSRHRRTQSAPCLPVSWEDSQSMVSCKLSDR